MTGDLGSPGRLGGEGGAEDRPLPVPPPHRELLPVVALSHAFSNAFFKIWILTGSLSMFTCWK